MAANTQITRSMNAIYSIPKSISMPITTATQEIIIAIEKRSVIVSPPVWLAPVNLLLIHPYGEKQTLGTWDFHDFALYDVNHDLV
jgi:hypothetical protein